MRIHRLELQAFGPFAGREEVDFTVLNDAGLFLLDGPTGAGKSTVLAGICFALYGSVPGERSPESLASTQSPLGTRPEVLLDFTVSGRRFEVLRWPRYRRPAKRRLKDGTGLTEEKAGAVLREHRGGQWQEVSTRADEIGQLLGTVLHLDAQQFMRVVLLPQGEFATFLRARSAEKESLLRQLFGTGRFDGVEDFLARRHRELEAAVSRDRDQVAAARGDLLACLDDGLGDRWWEPAPAVHGDAGSGADPAGAQDRPGDSDARAEPCAGTGPEHWPDDVLGDHAVRTVGQAVTASAAARQEAARHLARAQERLTALTGRRQDLRQATAWRDRSVRHRELAAQVAEDRTALERHGVAVSVDRRAREAEAAGQAHQAALETLGDLRAVAEADTLCARWFEDARGEGDEQVEARYRVLRQRADVELDRLAVREQTAGRLHALETEAAGLGETIAARTERAAGAEAERRDLDAQREELSRRVEDLGAPAAGADAARTAVQEATERLTAAREHEEHRAALRQAEDALRTATDRAQQAVDEWHRVVERRLAGAASLLAAQLREGEHCPVCGSVEHPDPAEPGDAEISAAAQEEARSAMDQQTARRHQAQEAVERVRRAAEASRLAASGLEPEEAQAALDRSRSALQEAENAATALAQARTALEENDRARQDLDSTATSARQEAAVAASRLEAAREEADRLRADLEGALAGREDLAELRRELTRTGELVDAVLEAARQAATHRSLARQAAESLAEELRAGGFATVEAVRQALLAAEDERVRADRVRDWDREAAALAELEASESVRRGRELIAEGAEAPTDEDLDRQEAAVAAATEAKEEAAERAGGLESLQRQVRRHVDSLEDVTGRSSAQLADLEEAEGLLRLVRGQGENALKMTLGGYVLAGRLEEVVASATERLVGMTQGRYELRHDDAARGRGVRGLDITVYDRYTEDERPAGTLSGGETFMASLALALGLADTVQAEAGGVDMDTLFVDEGFGSLDAASLEDVMEVLDGLQAGGRTVGVVSHVERMKQDIGYRLAVHKTRQGSTLEVVVPDR